MFTSDLDFNYLYNIICASIPFRITRKE